MIGAVIDSRLILMTVIALVVDERDAVDTLREEPIAGHQSLGGRSEFRRVVSVTRINFMEQRDVKVLRYQQCQPHDTQVHALFLALTPLGERRSVIEAIDEGIEVGGVIEQTGEIDLEPVDQRASQVLFDGTDLVGVEITHMVPEALAAQKIAPDRKETAQDATLVPLGYCCLAGWSKAAVDGGKSHVGADTDALVSFPSVAIDSGDQIQFLCQVIQGGGSREVRQDDLLGLWDLRRGTHSCRDVFGLAEVFLPNDLWHAVDTLAFAGIPVGTSPDHLLVQADGH